jgi:uncharacterized protein YjhX (UPF0386 family)
MRTPFQGKTRTNIVPHLKDIPKTGPTINISSSTRVPKNIFASNSEENAEKTKDSLRNIFAAGVNRNNGKEKVRLHAEFPNSGAQLNDSDSPHYGGKDFMDIDCSIFDRLQSGKVIGVSRGRASNSQNAIFDRLKNGKVIGVSRGRESNSQNAIFDRLKNGKVIGLSRGQASNSQNAVFDRLKTGKVTGFSRGQTSKSQAPIFDRVNLDSKGMVIGFAREKSHPKLLSDTQSSKFNKK